MPPLLVGGEQERVTGQPALVKWVPRPAKVTGDSRHQHQRDAAQCAGNRELRQVRRHRRPALFVSGYFQQESLS